MELKLFMQNYVSDLIKVLIVPSGIETKSEVQQAHVIPVVLIVPSGIETAYDVRSCRHRHVLIVPSGIETPRYLYKADVEMCINCT